MLHEACTYILIFCLNISLYMYMNMVCRSCSGSPMQYRRQHVYMHTDIHICIYVHTWLYIHMSIYISIYIDINTRRYVQAFQLDYGRAFLESCISQFIFKFYGCRSCSSSSAPLPFRYIQHMYATPPRRLGSRPRRSTAGEVHRQRGSRLREADARSQSLRSGGIP